MKYRPHATEDPSSDFDEGAAWVELELRHFTRELPLSNLEFGFLVALWCPFSFLFWFKGSLIKSPTPEKGALMVTGLP